MLIPTTLVEVITLETLLVHFRGNQSDVARFLGINRTTLSKRIISKETIHAICKDDGTYLVLK